MRKIILWILVGSLVIIIGIALGLFYLTTTQISEPPQFAFASDRSGAGDIYVVDANEELRNLTDHPASDWDPVWSPTGDKLAFTSHRSGDSDIWLLDLLETETPVSPRNLTNNPAWDYSPTWSPSGQSVAFISERDGDPELFVQNLESDTAIQLTFNNEHDHRPVWSPDGKLIAFASVRDGIEKIYLIRPDGTDEQLAIPFALQGTSPAWSPDSQQLAFIGWDEQNQPGIYVIGPAQDDLERVYKAEHWLGSLNWSGDGAWWTFTSWQSGNHEVYALPVKGGDPIRLSYDEAWDDMLVPNPARPFTVASQENVAQAAPAWQGSSTGELVLGLNLADLSMAYLVNDLGMNWAKGYVNWATVEPHKGDFRWIDPDNVVKAYGDQQLKILMRVHGTPDWARPADTSFTQPPDKLDDFSDFMTALAIRYKGQVSAYEIWNEPNLYYEWGDQPPDPSAYTDLLKVAYRAVKAVDPQALIISGGLSTTGEGSPTAFGDLAFIQGMYEAGAKGHFDALGSHPYAFGRSPAEVDPWGLSLSRVAEQHAVMEAAGDGETPIWITELGWVIQSHWDLGEHQSIGVSEAQQAEYLVDTVQRVPQAWPYVEAVFFFNLDFSTVAWYPAAEPMRWYALLNPDRTPRPAYTELRQTLRTP
ncbi:MAG TPA: cellulase family glycosylhydrolase [Anaerolineae bacterium]|nr:cellulase family glycosylhydrolase [Anaerolineae bacterium]HMR62925.1 cellulase family glycosylhydrolase [Anaerolineae bacterium]